ncbi:MAG: UPF0182 family protein [Peptococcaceae bacterium]|nr:UPF0182 family protein [Peptococcaceae bacterium]MDH7524568.1 UPF0182 family protein [Peptococcaceae bacterium]
MFEDIYEQQGKVRKFPGFHFFNRKVIGLLALIFLFIVIRVFIYFRLDWNWFKVLGYDHVFWRSLLAKLLIGGSIFLAAFALNTLNLWLVHRVAKRPFKPLIMLAVALFTAGIVAGNAGAQWLTVLSAFNAVPFGVTDPQFHLDIGFYAFKLPFLWLVYRLVNAWLIVNLIATVIFYLLYFPRGMEIASHGFSTRIFTGLEKRGLTHAGFLLGLTMAWQAVQYKLSTYELLYSQTGSVIGAGAADVGARLPAYNVMIGLSILLGFMIIVTFKRRLKLALVSIAAFFGAAVLLTGFIPGLYQKLVVDPDELGREKPYLERNIKYTRMAYGLDKLNEVEYNVGELSPGQLSENRDIIDNIRILDHRATRSTYGQQQEIRLYYDFVDVDVDRYMVDGNLTQVFLSGRELNQKSLPEQARTFNNLVFKYTHGFGLVMSPTNSVTETGMPAYLIQDIPPQSSHFKVSEPRIYFGEITDNNVIVNTGLKEFDYPVGNDNAEYLYEGNKGIPMTFLNKVLLAVRDMQVKYLLSDYITSRSQYLETRNIKDRVKRIAPFLIYDRDPYLVLGDDGKLYYMLDAYTATNKYPYSQAVDESGSFNYLRNSVKITVDAYSGEVNYYLFDKQDPIIMVYRNIFPGLFKEAEDMPADLRQHVRYPEDLFTVQSHMLRDYHMGNTTVFYNREDRWEFSQEIYTGKQQPQEPYYCIIRLPGEKNREFILMRSFTPTGKQNQVAWLAARSDGENYGKLLLYKFPKGVQVPGTIQVESMIDQDPGISSQLTLWGQGGSRVIRGNLLVYPIGGSLLYVEPLYIESEQNKFPQLRKVFVFYKDRVIMEDSLEKALASLFGRTEPAPGKEQRPGQPSLPLPADDTTENLIKRLVSLHKDSRERLKAGDWEGFGRLQKEIDSIIEALEK